MFSAVMTRRIKNKNYSYIENYCLMYADLLQQTAVYKYNRIHYLDESVYSILKIGLTAIKICDYKFQLK